MASKLQQERRAEFKRYKEDVAKEGKPFFPYAILHDTIMSLVVVAVIIGLAVIWKFTSDDGDIGPLGPLYTDKADPGTTNFVPRPDWFFYFLFYLLRIFKWPETVVLGTVGVPTLLLVLLIGLPFFDRRPERAMLRRPVAFVAAILVVISMGVLTWKGATAKESLGSENVALVPEWAEKQGFADDPVAVAGRDAVRRVGLPELSHLPRRRQQQPRRTRPLGGRRQGARHRVAGRRTSRTRASKTPGSPMPSFAAARRREPDEDRHLPRSLQGREVTGMRARGCKPLARSTPWSGFSLSPGSGGVYAPVMRVFLGVTGASGAPYAARLLQALAAADCEIGLVASAAGVEVIATELYGDASLPRDEVLERFVGDASGQVTVYGINDYKSPYASGSARVDAYVVCPCSMSTVGTLATGAMANLIHRAASVALKERRKLVLVPRETPLSLIHLRGLATLHEAGAVILFAAPGFYHGAKTIDDLVDFVVARALDQIGIDHTLTPRWGQP